MKEITVIEGIAAPELFGVPDKVEELLGNVEEQARSIVPDLSTAKGRKSIASNSARVSKSKTYLDALGKDLVSGWKAKAKLVDAERKLIRDRLDALRDEVRKPLTDWEDADKARVTAIEDRIITINNLAVDDPMDPMTSVVVTERLVELGKLTDYDWEEFEGYADIAWTNAKGALEALLARRVKEEKDAAELERLRAEQEVARVEEEERHREEQQRLRDERIKEQAAKEAREEAAREQAAAQERAEAARKLAELKAEEARRQAEAKAAEEKARVEREKQTAIREKQAAERAAQEARDKAAQEAAEAVEAERARVLRQQERERAAAVAREADAAHRKEVNSAVIEALVSIGLTKTKATTAVIAIANRQIPHVTIRY